MKYLISDPSSEENDIGRGQWVEASEDRCVVYRYINFTNGGVYRGVRKEGVAIHMCAFPKYSREISKDKFDMVFSIAKGLPNDF